MSRAEQAEDGGKCLRVVVAVVVDDDVLTMWENSRCLEASLPEDLAYPCYWEIF